MYSVPNFSINYKIGVHKITLAINIATFTSIIYYLLYIIIKIITIIIILIMIMIVIVIVVVVVVVTVIVIVIVIVIVVVVGIVIVIVVVIVIVIVVVIVVVIVIVIVVVIVIMIIISMNRERSISSLLQDLSLDMFIRQFWNDPRLKHNIEDDVILSGELRHAVWLPDSYFLNLKTATMHNFLSENSGVRINQEGDVAYSTRWVQQE